MRTGSGLEVGLVDDDHLEALGKLVIQHLCLVPGHNINAGLALFIGLGCHQVLVWEFGIFELVTILPARAFASIGI